MSAVKQIDLVIHLDGGRQLEAEVFINDGDNAVTRLIEAFHLLTFDPLERIETAKRAWERAFPGRAFPADFDPRPGGITWIDA